MSAPALSELVQLGLPELKARYGARLTPAHHHALLALQACRTGRYGGTLMACQQCGHTHAQLRSCGHRSCSQCQQHTAQQWLARQQVKLLPVPYFLVTFTVPQALRPLMYRHQAEAYNALFAAVAATLKTFGRNHQQLRGEIGFCAVLHTHSRRLDYHPHIHVILPGGSLDERRRQWRKLTGSYRFNGRQLATVFRAKLLDGLRRAGLDIPFDLPRKWVVQCQRVGRGLPALKYLSRYLYRGVISQRDIVDFDAERRLVTFRYQHSKTRQPATRTLPLTQFLWRLMVHVLPTGYRRVRDFGLLHAGAKALLRQIQRLLRVTPTPQATKVRTSFLCPVCRQIMTPIATIPGWRPT